MKASYIAISIIAITVLAIGGVMARRAMVGRKAHADIDQAVYPTRGIDISAHNGEIDFDEVREDGIEFVYIKISEGASWRDSAFETNYAGARDAGLKVGVYHFFRFDVAGWRQSVNVLRALDGRPLDLPVAIDLEEWTNPTEYTTEEITDNLRSMIELLRQNGREPIIYTNKNGYYRFVRSHFQDVGLWVCSFTTPPIPERDRWHLWQHSHSGRVRGIQGNVDLCTFNTPSHGSFESWLGNRPGLPAL